MLNAMTALTSDVGQSLPYQFPFKVLVLDDSTFDRLRIKRELTNTGMNVQTDEISCVCMLKSALQHKRYDLVVVDYYLPDGTGEDALDILMADETHSDVTSVIVSGNPWMKGDSIRHRGREVAVVAKDQLGSGKRLARILAEARSV